MSRVLFFISKDVSDVLGSFITSSHHHHAKKRQRQEQRQRESICSQEEWKREKLHYNKKSGTTDTIVYSKKMTRKAFNPTFVFALHCTSSFLLSPFLISEIPYFTSPTHIILQSFPRFLSNPERDTQECLILHKECRQIASESLLLLTLIVWFVNLLLTFSSSSLESVKRSRNAKRKRDWSGTDSRWARRKRENNQSLHSFCLYVVVFCSVLYCSILFYPVEETQMKRGRRISLHERQNRREITSEGNSRRMKEHQARDSRKEKTALLLLSSWRKRQEK